MIVGGGFAALETALALRALASERLRLTLISPSRSLAYRPAATSEAFADGPSRAYDLATIADDLGATYHRARLEAVAPQQKRVRLATGMTLSYDVLVLAIGARARAGISGALMFRDQRDVPAFQRLLDDADAGRVRHLVFAVPSGCSWPLPLYELALLSATRAQDHDSGVTVTIVTPEAQPLAVFGASASKLIADLLNDLDVRFMPRTSGAAVDRDGGLVTVSGPPIRANGVVAVPQLTAQRITGVPATWWGFVPTDKSGLVEGLVDVYEVAIEVSNHWRGLGIAGALLGFALEFDTLEDIILFAMGLSWHWDMAGLALSEYQYRALIARLFASQGFVEYPTTEPDIRMDPGNILVARIGKRVDQQSIDRFLNRLLAPPPLIR